MGPGPISIGKGRREQVQCISRGGGSLSYLRGVN